MPLLIVALLAIPLGLDLYLPVPEDNPLRREDVELGRRLFFDRALSRDRRVACASCHEPALAFSDGRPFAIGVFNRVGRRSAPAIVNRAYGDAFFWDGRAASLEQQVLEPIQDPNEMDLTLPEASRRVGLPVDRISRALASYVRSILSGNSRFDRFMDGNRAALSEEEQAGLRVFRGNGNCTQCHVGPTFTDEQFHNTGVAWRGRADDPAGGALLDTGRFQVTGRDRDRGAFKTPTLRDVARTAPYMHDGGLPTLHNVVEYYARGGNRNPWIDNALRPLSLSTNDKRALTAFLVTLSGDIHEGTASVR
jgi:cytochrome c peroxidase